jgi:anti-anti-sigma factor
VDAQSPNPNSTSVSGEVPVILSGSLDQYNAESLKQQLLVAMAGAAGAASLLLDMTAVEHLDASGLQVLVACRAGLKQEKLNIRGANPAIQHWMRVAGADALFSFLDANG